MNNFIEFAYLLASIAFILSLKLLNSPETARRGVLLAEIGMLIAILGTLIHHDIISYEWVAAGLVIGTIIGIPLGLWVPMTAMPERIALSHAFGALAAALVGVSEYYRHSGGVELDTITMVALGAEVMLGCLTFTGSLIASAKLHDTIKGFWTYKGQNFVNLSLLSGIVGIIIYLTFVPQASIFFYIMMVLAFAFGVMLVMPIGAADMPVVISILNSYAGLAAAATGFVLSNKVLIIAGALDGASGLILSLIMCKAMNRSAANVFFGGFGQQPVESTTAPLKAPAQAALVKAEAVDDKPAVKKITHEEAAILFRNAKKVIVVPGYGMAAAQAQHVVGEFAEMLKGKNISIKYAIHPVAGRMPGHMNVLLAEAGVPYTDLIEMEEINHEFPETDVAIVIGANDITNPAARHDKKSPIYGMPILDVDKAKTVIVCKRSMKPGFAGIDNELYLYENTRMLFGDAKDSISKVVERIKAS
jgi:NAD(P) transhydrogenase subunit beta